MAIWQLGFYIIPEEKIDFDLPCNKTLDESLLEWNLKRIDKKSLKVISKYLPIEKSWSKDITQYGNLESTCMEIANDVISIRIRLDLARITKTIFEAVLSFILANRCILYRIDTGDCYPGDRRGLSQLVVECRRFRIMRESNKFLDEVREECF